MWVSICSAHGWGTVTTAEKNMVGDYDKEPWGKMSTAPGTMGMTVSTRGTGQGGDTTNPPPPMDNNDNAWEKRGQTLGINNFVFFCVFIIIIANQ